MAGIPFPKNPVDKSTTREKIYKENWIALLIRQDDRSETHLYEEKFGIEVVDCSRVNLVAAYEAGATTALEVALARAIDLIAVRDIDMIARDFLTLLVL